MLSNCTYAGFGIQAYQINYQLFTFKNSNDQLESY